MSLYLKWTAAGRVPSHQGGDPIPYRKWTPRVADPAPCELGWHACRWEDALSHISTELWVCELDGVIAEADNKVAAESLRIVRKVPIGERELRLFAADCAERVLPFFERHYPDDHRPREAIRVARLYAEGQATRRELIAARDAARDAARNAARRRRSAARDAAWAAWAAARAAAWAAARDAAWDARDAARAAARAAGAAAEAAAGAARDAEHTWQTDRLLVHYGGLDPADFAHRGAS